MVLFYSLDFMDEILYRLIGRGSAYKLIKKYNKMVLSHLFN